MNNILITNLGVKFSEIEYFDVDKVRKAMPEMMVPIKMLQECREKIKHDIEQQEIIIIK